MFCKTIGKDDVTVKVKFVGSFRTVAGKSVFEMELGKIMPMSEVVKFIVRKIPSLSSALVDASIETPRTSMLVLVNGKEISVLNRFDTVIKDGDVIVFVPVVHGG